MSPAVDLFKVLWLIVTSIGGLKAVVGSSLAILVLVPFTCFPILDLGSISSRSPIVMNWCLAALSMTQVQNSR